MKPVGEQDAANPQVRFDERAMETEQGMNTEAPPNRKGRQRICQTYTTAPFARLYLWAASRGVGEIAFVNFLRWQRERKQAASEDAGSCRLAPPMAQPCRNCRRIALSSTAARTSYPMPVSFAQSSSTPCWRPQSVKSRGCGGRAPAITPAGAAVQVC